MRDIKFRGLDIEFNFVYGFYWASLDPQSAKTRWRGHYIHNGVNISEPTMIEGGTLGQYTGLKDKNGVEIYEGDIIKSYQADENEVFWYKDGSWCMSNYHAGALPLGEYSSVSEVIGNIHQNKDLLNEN